MSPTPVRAPARTRRSVGHGRPDPGHGRLATSAATAPARRREPARPGLRLVDDANLQLAQRRRRGRFVAVAAATVVCGSLFALAGAHALLVSGQVRLDRLEGQVSEEQARYQELRLQVAQLESPGRIVAEAQTRLAMVPPPSITYLTPTGPSQAPEPLATSAPGSDTEGGSEASWAAIKPYLGERP